MEVQKNVSLTDKHTFGLPWKSRFFVELKKESEFPEAVSFVKEKSLSILVLGGGSNLLPTKTYQGLVIQNNLKGKEIIKETKNDVWVRVSTGEDWHKLVLWSIRNNYFGLENLSLIPGTVGGAVVQNIGAYDVDIQRFVTQVSTVSLKTGKEKVFTHEECKFDYRNSIFKSSGKWFVTSVTLKLSKKFKPVLSYKPLRELANSKGELSAQEISKAVIKIRKSKLPDWKKIGTAGSFFGNPRITKTLVKRLQEIHPGIPIFYNYNSNKATIPAGWLIQHSSLKQKDRDEFLYPKHSLIVINKYKGADIPKNQAQKTKRFIEKVMTTIQKDFGIILAPEVRVF